MAIVDIFGNEIAIEAINNKRVNTFTLDAIGQTDWIFLETTDLYAQLNFANQTSIQVVRFEISSDAINFTNLDIGNRQFTLELLPANNGIEGFSFLGKIRFFRLSYISGTGPIEMQVFI